MHFSSSFPPRKKWMERMEIGKNENGVLVWAIEPLRVVDLATISYLAHCGIHHAGRGLCNSTVRSICKEPLFVSIAALPTDKDVSSHILAGRTRSTTRRRMFQSRGPENRGGALPRPAFVLDDRGARDLRLDGQRDVSRRAKTRRGGLQMQTDSIQIEGRLSFGQIEIVLPKGKWRRWFEAGHLLGGLRFSGKLSHLLPGGGKPRPRRWWAVLFFGA